MPQPTIHPTEEEAKLLDSTKTVNELNAGRTSSDADRLKTLYIHRFGFQKWQQLCQSSSKSYGIKQ